MAEFTLKPIREAVMTMEDKIVKRKTFSVPKDASLFCMEYKSGDDRWINCEVDTVGEGYATTRVSKINGIHVNPENIGKKHVIEVGTGVSLIPLKSETTCTIVRNGLTYALQCGKKLS
jgi:hypothetical protein